ncbi:hypothetical protein H0A36_30860, partial [Endozoicomonas sp. SM1973]
QDTLTTVQKSLENQWLSTTTQVLTHDDYGNVTSNNTRTEDSYGHYEQTVNTDYKNNEGLWLLGLPELVKNTQGHTLAATKTQTTRFEYYDDTGALKKEIVEPNHSPLTLTTEYTYTSHGNPSLNP